MKTNLLALAILLTATIKVFAQIDNGTMPRVAVGFGLGIATGKHADDYPLASGFGIKFEFPVSASPVSIMFSGAYNFMLSNDGYRRYNDNYDGNYSSNVRVASFAPVELGLRVYINRFFLEGNAGASFNLNENHSNYTNKNVALIIAPNLGYAFRFKQSKKYGLDLSLGYETRLENYQPYDFSSYGSYNQIALHAMFSIGY